MRESFFHNQGLMVEILNGVPHGIALLDSNLCIMWMNRFLESMTGYETNEVLGVYGDYVLRTNLGTNDQVTRSVLETGEKVSMDGNLINRGRSIIPVYCTLSRLHNEAGQPLGILVVIEDMSALQEARAASHSEEYSGNILGHSPQMKEVFTMMNVLARTDASVLITGETGTGKDKIAEQLHRSSQRKRQPFVKVNCGALPEALLESELFGHVKGAFTGAVKDNVGMFRLADKGTIFLTEIGDLSLPLQVKLLSVLDDQEFYSVGSSKKVRVDVRVIAATHRSLREEVDKGTFREDLFYRLNVLHLHVPPLRERTGDIRLLLDHFLKLFTAQLGKNITGFTPKALDALLHFSYPGNVRELRNVVEYAVNLCQKDKITLKDLPLQALHSPQQHSSTTSSGAPPEAQASQAVSVVPESWPAVERERILEALKQSNGNRTKAAAILGFGRTTLWRKLKKYHLT